MLHRRGTKGGIVLESLILLAGLGLIVKAFSVGASVYEFVHSPQAQTIEGTLIGKSNYGFTAVVEYKAPTGESVTFSQDGLFQNCKMGAPLPIIYYPDKIGYAHVNKITALWFRTVGLALTGFIVLGLGLRMRAKRSL